MYSIQNDFVRDTASIDSKTESLQLDIMNQEKIKRHLKRPFILRFTTINNKHDALTLGEESTIFKVSQINITFRMQWGSPWEGKFLDELRPRLPVNN